MISPFFEGLLFEAAAEASCSPTESQEKGRGLVCNARTPAMQPTASTEDNLFSLWGVLPESIQSNVAERPTIWVCCIPTSGW